MSVLIGKSVLLLAFFSGNFSAFRVLIHSGLSTSKIIDTDQVYRQPVGRLAVHNACIIVAPLAVSPVLHFSIRDDNSRNC